jgi:hypothetical protein
VKPMRFGADFDAAVVQTRLNALGASPSLVVDGLFGPKSTAAVVAFQRSHGLVPDGIVGPATLAALGIAGSASHPPDSSKHVSIPTLLAAFRQAIQERGYAPNDTLLSLMLGQLRGAEGAYPGAGGTLGGTNNIGAAQVTPSLASLKKGIQGWGAFAHKDTTPTPSGPQPYLGFYWIAPSALEAVRYWLDQWWGRNLLTQNPQNATTYASILYQGGYFEGNHYNPSPRDPSTPEGQQNVQDYAGAIARGRASAAELAAPPDGDPSKLTVDPSVFKSVQERGITPSMFANAKTSSVWASLLPASFDDFVRAKGVVWYGPAVGVAAGGTAALLLLAGGVLFLFRKRLGF